MEREDIDVEITWADNDEGRAVCTATGRHGGKSLSMTATSEKSVEQLRTSQVELRAEIERWAAGSIRGFVLQHYG